MFNNAYPFPLSNSEITLTWNLTFDSTASPCSVSEITPEKYTWILQSYASQENDRDSSTEAVEFGLLFTLQPRYRGHRNPGLDLQVMSTMNITKIHTYFLGACTDPSCYKHQQLALQAIYRTGRLCFWSNCRHEVFSHTTYFVKCFYFLCGLFKLS
jgi:hypothetical protein